MERTADIDLMAANAVVRGWCDDWDTLTRNRGKNGYFLRRATDGKWMLIQWDSDNTFSNANADFIGNLAGVQNFYSKPYVQQRVNHYLHEMVTKYTANSDRLDAWFQCEEDASTSYSANQSTYDSWNASRLAKANSTIGTTVRNTNFNVTTGNGSSTNTSADTITLNGTSGENAFTIRAPGHPEARYTFTSTTAWTLTGIQLKEGSNTIVVEALDQEGLVVSSETFTVTKSGNAQPVVVLEANPGSFNAPVTSLFELDASGSYDPEGTALTFDWFSPDSVTMTNPTPSSAHFRFNIPGHYHITLNVTDADGATTIVNREVVVYAGSGRDSFSAETLAPLWTLENLALRNGSTPSASYSLDDVPNSLALKVEDDSAKPLTLSTPSHPALWRDTPADTDWSFATDLLLASVQQGDFYTGVIMAGVEDGSPVRYTIGLENGDFLRAKRTTSSGTTQLASIAWTPKEAVIRIRRTGTQLIFEWREAPGLWNQIHSRAFAAASSVNQTGLFAATDTPQSLRVEFDYALLVDPGFTSPTLQNLRLTEVMYNPKGSATAEFIEFKNTGTSPLVLTSVTMDDTHPFGAFTFSNVTLPPGQYGVIVANELSFRAEYGNIPLIIGQWTGGSLSNGGENIVVRDPLSNIIHDFDYDDAAPWPVEADGDGPSLEVLDPEGNYSDPLNWRASAFTNGSPGQEVATDLDGDGLSDIQESALGTNPNLADTDKDGFDDGNETAAGTDPLDPSSFFKILSVLPGPNTNEWVISWASIPGRVYTVQSNKALSGNWLTLQSVIATETTTSLTDTTLLESQFYRIKVTTN
ncbi:lamin tail domain-containing protein [Verrucomicrobiaceae bacterium 227]